MGHSRVVDAGISLMNTARSNRVRCYDEGKRLREHIWLALFIFAREMTTLVYRLFEKV